MAELKPFTIAQLFTGLVGRDVGFAQVTKPSLAKAKQMYGVYLLKPMDSTAVAQADLLLLGSLAGAMLGLPADSIKERISEPKLDEALRDAIHEILNVTSTVVSSEHRAVFQTMYPDPSQLPKGASDTIKLPIHRSYFNVTVNGYDGGSFAILSPTLI